MASVVVDTDVISFAYLAVWKTNKYGTAGRPSASLKL
jgi:hypothetical protein